MDSVAPRNADPYWFVVKLPIMRSFTLILIWLLLSTSLLAQDSVKTKIQAGKLTGIQTGDSKYVVDVPLVSFQVKNKREALSPSTIKVESSPDTARSIAHQILVTFTNPTTDTLYLRNVVPFGDSKERVYITGLGDHPLSRTHLFLPGRQPVNVIVPDNAWELGYSAIKLKDDLNACALARRLVPTITNGQRRRFETILYPGGSVTYRLYLETYQGEWQNGLKKMFQEHKLFDLETFDNNMFEREDLQWIKRSYVMHLMMGWDKSYYDATLGRFTLPDFVRRGKLLYGGDDVVCLWPTWPTLGLDQRNQFDMYRDLPGGLPALRQLADTLRNLGTRFFIAYNPWDESTRAEGHLQGLENLIRETGADGVVLDTKGESSKELQQAADKVRAGVVMYSEGMAVPKDMPGIVSGRVHNALYYPPMLNLNKLIKPDFAIFRVTEVYKEPIRREYATSFFNGYGTEINQFAAGHPDWETEQYEFLGLTSMILRENSTNFNSHSLTPLFPTTTDGIWVNAWPTNEKTLYTIFSLIPEGFSAPLFQVESKPGFHFVDLWNHELIVPVKQGGGYWLKADVEGFHRKWKGTNNEGASGCIAQLPELLKVRRTGPVLRYDAPKSSIIKIWAGVPSYGKKCYQSKTSIGSVNLLDEFGAYEGKIIVQAFQGEELIDETIVALKPGEPVLTSTVRYTSPVSRTPKGMVRIPAGQFIWKTTHGDDFIRYPDQDADTLAMHTFYMDRHPVTNKQFKKFLDETGYQPADTANFLRNWKGRSIPAGMEDFPVVYVSYEDALAYARASGKRLPTEAEWQYGAQTAALNEWPWKQLKPVTRKEEIITETLTVTAIEGIDPKHTKLGDGKLYRVGSYPKGANPYGLQDLSGCVWQITNDVYETGSYRYIIMKGGSYYKPSSSWWYVQGGPRELHYRQYLLRVSQGFERNATVGFRCVAD
jgi:iron(II)-dependent oxidoreductase